MVRVEVQRFVHPLLPHNKIAESEGHSQKYIGKRKQVYATDFITPYHFQLSQL